MFFPIDKSKETFMQNTFEWGQLAGTYAHGYSKKMHLNTDTLINFKTDSDELGYQLAEFDAVTLQKYQ